MEDDLDESVFDYISEFDFEGLLPLFWIKCGKDKATLRQKLVNEDVATSRVNFGQSYQQKFRTLLNWGVKNGPADLNLVSF